jgi:hypothetical protein
VPTGTPKVEYPPLLQAGFHIKTVGKLRQLCVCGFPLSTTRKAIFSRLIDVIRKLREAGIVGNLWVDGSFLTQKINPNDVDIVLEIEADALNSGSAELKNAVAWLNSNLKATHLCDSYLCVVFPQGHANYGYGEWNKALWIRTFGFSRGNNYKGIVVIELR